MSLNRFAWLLLTLLLAQHAQAQVPLKVGLVVPLSGALKSAGNDIAAATNAWAADRNADGGLRGRKLEVRIYDDQSSADGARGAAAKAIDEGVELFVNCFGTVSCLEVASQAQAANIALLGPIAGAEVLRSASFGNVFSTRPSAAGELSEIFKYLAAIGQKSTTIIYQDDGFGKGYREALAKALAAAPGLRISNQFPIDLDRRNHEEVAARLVASGETFSVVLLSNTPNSIAMVGALDKLGYRGIHFNLAAQANEGFISAIQEKVRAQSLMISFVTVAPSPVSLAPAAVRYREVLAKWSKGASPAYLGLEAFNSMSTLEVVAGGYTPERVEATLRRHPAGKTVNRIPMSYDAQSRTLRGYVDIAVVSKSGQIRH